VVEYQLDICDFYLLDLIVQFGPRLVTYMVSCWLWLSSAAFGLAFFGGTLAYLHF
jgi:hypothetical protein